ncbi:hypothetical protein IWX90DRAFT_432208 [Phyllosticta citrichinensis]|uniref:Uncharacterized protein n=1 Tax=Phyllosticta citrichinensis TaxID=1130410 RepID=A0ABR1XSR7_9PEZI
MKNIFFHLLAYSSGLISLAAAEQCLVYDSNNLLLENTESCTCYACSNAGGSTFCPPGLQGVTCCDLTPSKYARAREIFASWCEDCVFVPNRSGLGKVEPCGFPSSSSKCPGICKGR